MYFQDSGSTLSFRLVVPKRLRNVVGQREIKCSIDKDSSEYLRLCIGNLLTFHFDRGIQDHGRDFIESPLASSIFRRLLSCINIILL
jgi:hypothetical protein